MFERVFERSRLSGRLKLRFKWPLSLALAHLAASESRRVEALLQVAACARMSERSQPASQLARFGVECAKGSRRSGDRFHHVRSRCQTPYKRTKARPCGRASGHLSVVTPPELSCGDGDHQQRPRGQRARWHLELGSSRTACCRPLGTRCHLAESLGSAGP